MESSTDSLPAHVQVVCPQCGRTITTAQSGNSTRCPKSRGGCGASVYVPAGTTRPPVTLLCKHCHSSWDTRAKAGNMVRCPNCKAPRRVPAAIREEPRYAPAPEPYRRRAPEVRPRRPPAPRPTLRATPAPALSRRPAPALPPGPTLADTLRALMRPAAPPAPRPAPPTARPPAPAPAEPAPSTWPRPAPPFRPTPPTRNARPGRVTAAPPNTFRDHHRRDSVGQLVISMGGALRIAWDTPPGMCEVMDVTRLPENQRCRGVASRGVVFWSQLSQEVTAYACPAHAVALAAATTPHPAITATVVGLTT